MTSVRVLVADDHKAVRDGLRLMLGLLGIEVIGAAADGTDTVRQAAANSIGFDFGHSSFRMRG
jgi:DNA-binding NarL/FixJ family response regulator